MVILYHDDEFTHTWLVEYFAAKSNICPGFTGKVLTLTHLPFEPGCEDYFFLEEAVRNFDHSLDSILMDSVDT